MPISMTGRVGVPANDRAATRQRRAAWPSSSRDLHGHRRAGVEVGRDERQGGVDDVEGMLPTRTIGRPLTTAATYLTCSAMSQREPTGPELNRRRSRRSQLFPHGMRPPAEGGPTQISAERP